MYGGIMSNILTNNTFKILLTSLLISIINVVLIINTPNNGAIDYVNPRDIYEAHKGEIYYSEDLERADEEYRKEYQERVKKLKELDRNNSFSVQEFLVVLTFLPWVIFSFLFPIIKKQLLWVFFFPILFFLLGLFSMQQLIVIGVILTFSFYLKNHCVHRNRKS